MLTARDEDIDKIIGLEVGADDYMTKPFNPRELVARVKSILRRAAPERRKSESDEIHHGDLAINAGKREVYVGDEEIRLAPKEFDLLWELLDHRGIVLTRDQLLERVWGYTFAGDTRTVDVHVRQIRRKLGDASPIVTVWGVGYKVASDRTAADHLAGYPETMLGTLRFRLTALFLAVVLVFGLVSIALAVRLFQDVTRQQSVERAPPRGERARRPLRRVGAAVVRRGREGARVRGEEARARDGRRAVLRRRVAVPRPAFRADAAAAERARRRRARPRPAGDRQFTPPGEIASSDRGGPARAARARDGAVRLAHRREARGRAPRAVADALRAPRTRARRRDRARRCALPVALAPPDRARPRADARDRRRRRRSLRRRDPGGARATTRSRS